MRSALAGLAAVLTLVAVAACAEPAPTATSPPTPTVTPTPSATPTPAPTPTPDDPEDLLDAMEERMAEQGSMAFDVRMEMTVQTDEGERVTSAAYAGDTLRFVYVRADLSVDDGASASETRLVSFNAGLYNPLFAYAGEPREWVPREQLPEFMEITHFLSTGSLYDGEYLPTQTEDGAETLGVSGTFRSGAPGGEGDFDVTYWIDAETGLLRRLTATSPDASVSGWAKLGGLARQTGAVTLTMRAFDYGKPLAATLPAFALPTFSHHAALLEDGRVLVVGGFTGVANNNVIVPFPLQTIQVYDMEEETWTLIPPLAGRSIVNSAARLADGRVLIVGVGDDGEGAASVFDPKEDSWELLPGSPAERGVPNMVLLDDGRVLAVGGADLSSSGYSLDPSDAVEIFDPRTGDWTQAAAMPGSAVEQSLAALRGGLVLAALPRDRGDSSDSPSVFLYDPAADAWRATAPNQPADYDSSVVPVIAALRDGRALATGKRSAAAPDEEFCDPALPANEGFPLPEWCEWSGVEIYDPSTDEWTLAAPMMQPRSDHTLTLLPDGRVLAAGGQLLPPGRFDPTSELDVLAATEVFDPSTLSWTPGPALAEARFGHTATLLPDGRILFIGGIGQEDEPYPPDTPGQVREAYPLRSVEILDLSAPAPDAGEGRSR